MLTFGSSFHFRLRKLYLMKKPRWLFIKKYVKTIWCRYKYVFALRSCCVSVFKEYGAIFFV